MPSVHFVLGLVVVYFEQQKVLWVVAYQELVVEEYLLWEHLPMTFFMKLYSSSAKLRLTINV